MRPQIIIFDAGGVFFKFKKRWEDPGFLSSCSVGPQDLELFFHGEIWYEFERGKISPQEFFVQFQRALGYAHGYERFVEDLCRDADMDREMYDLMLTLKVRFRYGENNGLWMLSNANVLESEYLHKRYPGFFANFTLGRTFFSHELGSRKPDPEIYKKMLSISRVSPYTALFIDDQMENGDYPNEIKMPFIRFQGIGQLKEAFKLFEIDIDKP